MARRTRKFSEDVPFSLTSMMDMMTIILVFMIKNLDAEGQLLTQAQNLILPVSTSKVQPTEVALTIVVDNKYVAVDNKLLVDGKDTLTTAQILEQEDFLVGRLSDSLKVRRAIELEHNLSNGQPGDEAGHIVVQIDKNIPFNAMLKVVNTCGDAGYTNIAFAVMEKNGGEE